MNKTLIVLAALAALGLQGCDVQVHDDAKTTVQAPQNSLPDNTPLHADQGASATPPASNTAAAPAAADTNVAANPAPAPTDTTVAANGPAPAPADTASAAAGQPGNAVDAGTSTNTASAPVGDASPGTPVGDTSTAQGPSQPTTGTMGAAAAPDATATASAGNAAPTELQRYFQENGSLMDKWAAQAGKANASASKDGAKPKGDKVSYQLPAMADPGDPEGARLLASHALLVPVVGVAPQALADNYEQSRGSRKHEAIDILAPRGTPVVAVDDGKVAKLFTSKPGGLTVYQFDPQGQLAYYYAHLDHYAPGLQQGMALRRGDLVGYVGTTGNADPGTPHLHFAVFKLGPEQQWWKGQPVNPYGALRMAQPSTNVASARG